MADGATEIESGGLLVGLALVFSGIAIAKAIASGGSRGRATFPIPNLPKVPPPVTPNSPTPPPTSGLSPTPTTHHTPTDFYAGKINELAQSVTRWWPQVSAQAALAGIPPGFAQAWLTIESGGNPCAVGELTSVGTDGLPREIGLFQIYNPDDFKLIRATAAELTAYCVRPIPGQRNPQQTSRSMTADEIAHHVAAGIDEIHAKRDYADRCMRAAGVAWPMSSGDYWSAVKLAHALPVEVNVGMAQVTKRLGRPPSSWREFRTTYEAIQSRAKFDPVRAAAGKDQDGYFRALENAEWTGGHVQPMVAP